jgi:hypothetical protein
MPPFIHYKEFEQNVKMIESIKTLLQNYNADVNGTAKRTHAELTMSRAEHHSLQATRSEFKGYDNVVEHFVQLIVFLIVILLSRSRASKVTSLDKIIVGETLTFLYGSKMLFMSLSVDVPTVLCIF